jgi:Ca2+-binding RTX toxin-like protein
VIDPAVVVYAGYIGGHRRDSARAVAVDASGNAYVTGAAASHQSSFPVRVGPDLTFNGSFEDAFVAKVDQSGKRLEYAGYIGGSGGETGSGIAVDASGNAYVAGYTSSTAGTFPATGGPDLTYGGRNDAFVAKVDATGTGLDYAVYVGGTNVDRGSAVAVDGSGNAYVTGFTRSHETSFPVTVGPDTTYSHAHDAFVAKVNAAGSGFDYAGYIGGLGNDQGAGIAVDSSGHAYVTGNTGSDQTTLPVTVGPDLVYNGNVDAFVANVDPTGIGFDYLGYIGGPNLDGGGGVAVDGAGHAYIAGGTFSTQSTFPVAVGPDLTYNGGHDAFVAKVDVSGAALDYAGYIGGAKEDGAGGIAVDGSGHAYVVGSTESGESTFPVSGGPDLTQNGDQDAYVAKVTASGHGLAYAGYVGGSKFEFGAGIAVDGSGNAYLSGITTSNHHTFPVTTGPDLTFNGGAEAFVAKVGRCTMTGTPGHDVLTGTAGDDVICGLGGDDTLTGGKGDDVLYGASGNDTLAPGPGRNTVYGGKGVDTVTYRSLPGGGVRVHLDTAPGTTGGGATDSLRSIRNVIGTSFGDRVHGDGAANTVLGLDGNDALYGRSGNDRLDGGSNGSSGDSLFGGPGTDTCMRGEHVAGCER